MQEVRDNVDVSESGDYPRIAIEKREHDYIWIDILRQFFPTIIQQIIQQLPFSGPLFLDRPHLFGQRWFEFFQVVIHFVSGDLATTQLYVGYVPV